MGKPGARLVLAALFFLSLNGCAVVRAALCKAFERPTLSFQKIEAARWSLDGVDLNVIFRVDNPNDLALEIAKVDYQFEVEGHRVFQGSPNRGVQLPAKGSRDLVFPARVRFIEVLPAVTAIFTKSNLRWKASGTLGVDTPIGILDYPLSKSGRVAVPDLKKKFR
jgi:LEA14-like dessication related protein